MRPLLLSALLLVACGSKAADTVESAVTAASTPPAPARPKNVILVIGDGMGPQQVGLLEIYNRRAPGADPERPTSFARMAASGSTGLSLHYPMDKLVTDSACSATQLALGMPAPSQAIGVDATGEPRETVLDHAMARGLATGLVSDTRLTHATPAAFAAHVGHRSAENTIAAQMIATGPDVMLSGGRRHFLPQGADGSRRDDDRDLLQEARDAGYTVVLGRQELGEAADAEGKLLGLFANSGMLDAIAERRTREQADRTEPGLTEMTTVALDRLARDEDGFFLMVESGQIDWASHANDAGWLLAEMKRADAMLDSVLDWAEARGDTLVVVTADHETGGFGLSYSRDGVPAPRDLPGSAYAEQPYAPTWNFGPLSTLDALDAQEATWNDVLNAFDRLPQAQRTPATLASRLNAVSAFDLDEAAAARVLAATPDPWSDDELGPHVHDFRAFYYGGRGTRSALVARELANAQNVVWATGTHTHTPVPVFAVGPGHTDFAGLHHHTDLGQKLIELVTAE